MAGGNTLFSMWKNQPKKETKRKREGEDEGATAGAAAEAVPAPPAKAARQVTTISSDSEDDLAVVVSAPGKKQSTSTRGKRRADSGGKGAAAPKPETSSKRPADELGASDAAGTAGSPAQAAAAAKPARKASPSPSRKRQKGPRVAKQEESDPTEGGKFPFAKKIFVLTGEFTTFGGSKDGVKDVILQLGGKVTSAVSGRTTYLVAGPNLEDGRAPQEGKKWKTAEEKGVKILEEADFEEMVNSARSAASAAKSEATAASAAVDGGAGFAAVAAATKLSSGSSSASATAASAALGKIGMKRPAGAPEMMLWVDKYKPRTVADLVGNKSNIDGLSNWLSSWEAIHLHKTRKPVITKNNMQARAVLLSGPPGIGKSSAAGIVAKSKGYDVMELNASDARSKKIVASVLGDAVNSLTLAGKEVKRVIIMDEVDGMSSDDRGGVQELIKLIKVSKVPIICICNDRQKSSVRSLANYCFDLRFMRPQVDSIVKRVAEIAQQEGMSVELNALRELAAAQQKDVRQIVGALQMWSRSTSEITYQGWMARKKAVNKDDEFVLSSFDACKFMFNEARRESQFDYRYNAFFVDYDLIPLMVQDNYITASMGSQAPGRPGATDATLERISEAADAVCDADIANRCVRGEQNWTLLPQVAALNLRVTSICQGNVGFPGFPQWLGKRSSQGKKQRLLSETAMHMRQRTMINTSTLRLDYLCTLRDSLLKPLLEGRKESVLDTIELMDAYGLSRDDMFETMQEVRIAMNRKNPFDKIDGRTKAAFTRKYNEGSHTSQALVEEAGIVGLKKTKAKGRKVAADLDDSAGGEGDGDEDGNAGDGDEADAEAEEVKQLLELQSSKKKSGKGSASGVKKGAKKAAGKGRAKR